MTCIGLPYLSLATSRLGIGEHGVGDGDAVRRDDGHGLAFPHSVVAKVDKVATCEWTARLLHAAPDYEAAKMNRREAEAGNQIRHEFDRLGMIPGHEDDAAATVLCGPLVEAFN